ncbi:TonB-dependent receptor [Lysobacter sp. BMK333-48F3]|uniref:TonB-dependent receptor n=1 Tax=Lysobacter sp. BMK333-48F3 TaxID=2867962 RepID=UPI001C8BFFA6|nr:TonB-dependent receptor [Lysobacter sp. BMK333-48F3]MBX9400003.1 TonB-dependent receptor [Lysobacter sp. BMK333-48F3]
MSVRTSHRSTRRFSRHAPALRRLGLALAGLAFAQAACADDSTTLDAVQVRAQSPLERVAEAGSRLGLSLRELPAAVEILDGETLRERGDDTPQRALARAAGVVPMGAPGNGNSSLSLRGFSGHGSVAQVYDGTRVFVASGTLSFPGDTWQLDRIEVLRGPASVLFGDSSVGGVVHYVPRALQSAPRREAMLAMSSWDGYRFGLGAGQGVGERVRWRADLTGAGGNGEIDRAGYERYGFSGALAWDLSPRLTATLKYDGGRRHDPRYFGTPLADGRLDRRLRERNYDVADSHIRYDDGLARLRFDYALGERAQLVAETYHVAIDRRWRNAESYAFDPRKNLVVRSDFIEIGHDQEQWGQRFDLLAAGELWGRAQRLNLGVEGARVRFTHSNNGPYGGRDTVPAFDFAPGGFVNLAGTQPRFGTITRQRALYLEHSVELWPRWTLVGGLRRERIELQRKELLTGTGFGVRFDFTAWRLGAVFALDQRTSLYAQTSKGIDPISGLVTLPLAQKDWSLTPARQIELGLKQSFAGGRGDWTLAAYRIEKRNLLSRDEEDPNRVQQIGQRSSRGLELGLGYALSPRWRIDANAALLDARFDDFSEVVAGRLVSRDGRTPANTPERVFNLWLGFDPIEAWNASLGLRRVGHRYNDNANSSRIDGYTVADAQLSWRARVGSRLTLRARNLGDALYVGSGRSQALLGPGREFELEWAQRF